MTRIFIIISVLSTFKAFAQKNDSTLLKADREFAALSYKIGVASAFEKFLADDAVFLSTTPLPIEGKSNFMKLFANTKSTVIWQPTGSFRDPSETSGYTYGLSKWMYPIADSLASSYYVYNTNWLKNSSNEWKVTTDIGTEISLKTYPLISKNNFKYSKNNFKYSKISVPKISKTINEGKYQIVYFSFESDRKGTVPAMVVKPTNKNNIAVVCYQHGIGEEYNKEYFLKQAIILAENGIASIMIDAPFRRIGESFIENGLMKDAEIIQNNCVEWLQALNILSKWNINSSNPIFVGENYGASVGSPLLGQP
jgi:ketosteroid isomerase-like protein